MECAKSEPNSDLEDGEIRDDDFEDISEGSLSEAAESRRDLVTDNATADPPAISGRTTPVDDLTEEEKYRLEALKSLLENTETNDENNGLNEEEQYRLEALKSLLERENRPDNAPLNNDALSKKRKKRKRANMNRRKRRKQERLKGFQSGGSMNILQETTTFLAQLAIDLKENVRKNVEKTEKTEPLETEPIRLENANVSDSQNRSWCLKTEKAVTLEADPVRLAAGNVFDSQNRSWYPKTSWDSDDTPIGASATTNGAERLSGVEETPHSWPAPPNNCIHNAYTEQQDDSEITNVETTPTLSAEPMNIEISEKVLHLESEPQKCGVPVEKDQVQSEPGREFYFEDRSGDFQAPPPPPIVPVLREVHSTIPEKSKYKLRYSRVQPESSVPNKQINFHTVPKYAAVTSVNRINNNASVKFANRNVYKKVAASMVPPTSLNKFPVQKHRQGKYKLNNVNKSKYVLRKELPKMQQQGSEPPKKSSVYSVNHMKTNFPEVNPKEFIIPLDEEDSSKEDENKENPSQLTTPRTVQSPKSIPCRVKATNEVAEIPRLNKEKLTQTGEKEKEAMRSKILSVLGSKNFQLRESEELTRTKKETKDSLKKHKKEEEVMRSKILAILGSKSTESVCRDNSCQAEDLNITRSLGFRLLQPEGAITTVLPSKSISNPCTFPSQTIDRSSPSFELLEPQMGLPEILSVPSESEASWPPMVAELQSESPKTVEHPWSTWLDREFERNRGLQNEEQSVLAEYEQHLRPEIIKTPSPNETSELRPLAERSASENSCFRMASRTSSNVPLDGSKIIYAEPQGSSVSNFLSENPCQRESKDGTILLRPSFSTLHMASSKVSTDGSKTVYAEAQGPSVSNFLSENPCQRESKDGTILLRPSFSALHMASSKVSTDGLKTVYAEAQGPSISDFLSENSFQRESKERPIVLGPFFTALQRARSNVPIDRSKTIYAEPQGPSKEKGSMRQGVSFSDFRVSENQCQIKSEERSVGQAASSSDSHIAENVCTSKKQFMPRINFLDRDGRVKPASSHADEIEGVVRAQCSEEFYSTPMTPKRGIVYVRRNEEVSVENQFMRFECSPDQPYSTSSEAGTSTTSSMSRRTTANFQKRNIPSSSKKKLQSEEVTSVKCEPNDEVVIKSEPMENVEPDEYPDFQSGDSMMVDSKEDWLDFRTYIPIEECDDYILRGYRANITRKEDQTGKIVSKAPKPVQQASRTETTENKNDRAFLTEAEENLIRIRTKLVQDLHNFADSVDKNKQESVKFSAMDKRLNSLKATVKKLEEELEGQRLRLRMSNSVVRSFYDGIELRSRTCSRLKELCTTIGKKTIGPEYKPPNIFEDMIVKRRQSFNGFDPDDLFPTKL